MYSAVLWTQEGVFPAWYVSFFVKTSLDPTSIHTKPRGAFPVSFFFFYTQSARLKVSQKYPYGAGHPVVTEAAVVFSTLRVCFCASVCFHLPAPRVESSSSFHWAVWWENVAVRKRLRAVFVACACVCVCDRDMQGRTGHRGTMSSVRDRAVD